jgi:putative transposase
MDLFQVSNLDGLRKAHRDWVDEAMANGNPFREDQWTESVAVGDDGFIEEVKDRLGARAKGRSIIKDGDQCQLRERQGSYHA